MCILINSSKSIFFPLFFLLFCLFFVIWKWCTSSKLIRGCGRCYMSSMKNDRKSRNHYGLCMHFVSKETLCKSCSVIVFLVKMKTLRQHLFSVCYIFWMFPEIFSIKLSYSLLPFFAYIGMHVTQKSITWGCVMYMCVCENYYEPGALGLCWSWSRW